MIGRDEDVVLKIFRRSVRRILIGQDEDVVLKIVRRSVRRIMIGRDEDVALEIVRRSIRRILIGRDEATYLYDDASDLSSCQTFSLFLLPHNLVPLVYFICSILKFLIADPKL